MEGLNVFFDLDQGMIIGGVHEQEGGAAPALFSYLP